MTRRYWATGAISAVLVLFWSCIAPLLGSLHGGGFHPAQAAQISSSLHISNNEASITQWGPLDQWDERSSLQIAANLPTANLSTVSQPTANLSTAHPLEQGRLAYAEGRYAEAVAQFSLAKGASIQAGSPLEQAQALSYLSLGQQKLGDWSAAERSVDQSLALIRRLAPSREQQLTLGRSLNTQGSLYFAKGQAREALAAWKAAEAAYQQAQDEPRQLGSLINQSQALQSLGFYGRARQTLEDIHQRLDSQSSELRLFGLQNLANMYWRRGDLEKSEAVLRQALESAPASTPPQQLGGFWVGLGNIEQARKNWPRSLHYYEQAATQASGELQFQARLNQFQLLIHLKEQAQARNLIAPLNQQLQALPPSRSVLYGATNFSSTLTKLAFANPAPQTSQADQKPGEVTGVLHGVTTKSLSGPDSTKAEVATSDDDSAKIYDPESLRLGIQTLNWAIDTARGLGDARAETYAQGYLGYLYERSQDWQQAQQLTQMAATQAERINAQDIGYQWQWQLARILKAQGEFAQAEKAYQNAFDMLQSLRSDLAAARPDLQFSFRKSVEPIYREFVDLLLRPVAPATEPSPEALTLAREVIEALQIAELNNFFHTACLQDQLTPVEKVDGAGAAIVYPIILPDRLTLILSLPDQPHLQSFNTEVPQVEFEQTLRQFRASLEKPYTDPGGKELGQQLYDCLIKPMESALEARDIKTLTFVLDGALRNVPMAALRNGDEYLIEKYSIALTPGLQLLDPKPIQLKNKHTLLAGVSESVRGFPALAYVETELAAIQRVVSHKLLLNGGFTRTLLEDAVQRSDFPVVHLATHGQFSSNSAETFILAWDEEVDVHDLSALLQGRDRPDPIELLVLSACETAAGDDRAALGLAGLSVQAGARSTLASLWSLDDESGAAFAQKFYEALLPGDVSRAEAVQAAQLALLNDPRYRKPQSWASYVLVGNWL